jgi:signal transduction histidine kinase
MAQLLQHTHETQIYEGEIDQAHQEIKQAQDQFERIRQENEALRSELVETKKLLGSNRSQVESLEALLIAHEEAQSIIAQMQTEIASLRQSSLDRSEPILVASSGVSVQSEQGVYQVSSRELEEELRITLKEVAQLQTVLSDADRKILELERGLPSTPTSFENMEIITNLAQELRQPMSSIVGYTDFLLGETVGILGNLQRKFLERVRLSAEKMSKLVDELIYITNAELTPMLSAFSPVDLNRVVDEAIAEISDQLRSKDIALRVDLQEQLPLINYDIQVLQDTLVTLLENAGAVTPEEGEIALRVKVESDDVIGRYILVQVADLGGGIDKEDLSRVLSPSEGQDDKPISGVGEALNKLPELRASIESMDGRIWIDSEPGMGSVFSLLLPIKAEAEHRDAGGGKPV